MPDGIELAATLYLPDDVAPRRSRRCWSTCRTARTTRCWPATTTCTPTWPAAGTPGPGWTSAAPGAAAGPCPGASTPRPSSGTRRRSSPGWPASPGAPGAVGMWGISWGGFNAIQVALRRPPALKAILAVDASDDLFHDDVHYIDGLPHLDEYTLMIDHLNMLPPAPDFPLDEAALARVDTEPWLISFLAQAAGRAVLAAGVAAAGLRAAHRARLPDRRLVRRVPGLGAADAGARARPGQGADRPVEPRLPAQRGARPGHRVARGRGALVGPLAQGRRHRHHGRAAGHRVRAALASAGPGAGRDPRAVAAGARAAAGAGRVADLVLRGGGVAVARRPRPRPPGQLRYVPSAGIAAGHWWGS